MPPGRMTAADAANAFLKSLSTELRAAAQFPLDSSERTTWNFVPMARKGAQLLKLDDKQAELIGPLLATALSPEGLVSARGVIKHENILRRRRNRARHRRLAAAIPVCTTPPCSANRPRRPAWAWRFEGHHLSLNVTQLPGQPAAVVGPLFMGANPATVLSGAQAGFRLLAAEEDLGRALITLLSDEKRKTAMIRDTAFSEILTGNDREVKLELAGLAAADMYARSARPCAR